MATRKAPTQAEGGIAPLPPAISQPQTGPAVPAAGSQALVDRALELGQLAVELQSDGPSVQAAIPLFLDVLDLSRSPKTIVTYRSGLNRFTDWLEVNGLPPDSTATTDLPADTLERFAVAMNSRYPERKSTLWTYINAARAFYRFLYARRIGPRATSYELVELRLKEILGRFE